MNEALNIAFDKLYGFTSSDNGIRHKLLEESNSHLSTPVLC